MLRANILTVFLINSIAAVAQDIRVHDPVMAREGNRYYLFCTGMGISVFSSDDLKTWKIEKPVFDSPPLWAVETVNGYKGHTWAPDIVFRNGKYYLYYSVSAFGKNTSCIGVATNTTLDPQRKEFKWQDHGKIIQSVPGRDLWNAIDPNLVFDENEQPWLVFGSFWSGMKLVKMDPNLTAVAQPEEWYTVAKRPRDFKTVDEDAGDGAVEAPFIFRKGKYYYLFVSFDYCCRGKESNYKIAVGRSETITGPYVDQSGKAMNEGGGTILLQGDKKWAGVGHNSVYTFDGQDYIVFHAYDNEDDGKPKLRIEKIRWDESAWPVVVKSK